MNEIDLPKFCISGLSSSEDVNKLDETIQKLGGILLKCSHLHSDCTHLLVQRLARTEKVLSAIGRGLPILDLWSYLEFCQKEGRWSLDDDTLAQFDLASNLNTQQQQMVTF